MLYVEVDKANALVTSCEEVQLVSKLQSHRNGKYQLYYQEDGKGQDIVLLHCLPMDHYIWSKQIFFLSAFAHTVALDFPGLGQSSKIGKHCTIDTLANDVNELFREEGIENATMVGLSIGGCVALSFCINYPNKVSRLILSGTTYSSKDPALQSTFQQRIRGYSSGNPRSYFRKHISELVSPKFRATNEYLLLLQRYLALSERYDFRSIRELYRALILFNLDDSLREIKVPTLIIAGKNDAAYSYCVKLHERIASSKFVAIRNAGHLANFEKPADFNIALKQFIMDN